MRVVKDLNRLRQVQNASQQRDLLTCARIGLTTTIPVLVERANRLCALVRQSEHRRDVRASLAPRPHDFPRSFRSASHHREQTPCALQEELARRRVACDEAERLERMRPVDPLQVRLQLLIVLSEERREARGIARAPQILQQQRVEQRLPLRLGKPQRPGDAHANETASDGVSGPLPLRQVQRIGEASEHAALRDSDGALHR